MPYLKDIFAKVQQIGNADGDPKKDTTVSGRFRSTLAGTIAGAVVGMMVGYSKHWNMFYSAIGGGLAGGLVSTLFTPKE